MTNAVDAPYVLQLSRRFDAPPERVFDAWVGPKWGEWLPPGGAHCSVTAIEPKVGGKYRVDMTMSDGRVVRVTGVYREMVRPETLVFTWLVDYVRFETVITIKFRRDGSGTLMTFRQDGILSIEQRDNYNNGWTGKNGSFAKLEACLARDAR
jgi:uncharacterized protein YndB with AHSA1/START domain